MKFLSLLVTASAALISTHVLASGVVWNCSKTIVDVKYSTRTQLQITEYIEDEVPYNHRVKVAVSRSGMNPVIVDEAAPQADQHTDVPRYPTTSFELSIAMDPSLPGSIVVRHPQMLPLLTAKSSNPSGVTVKSVTITGLKCDLIGSVP